MSALVGCAAAATEQAASSPEESSVGEAIHPTLALGFTAVAGCSGQETRLVSDLAVRQAPSLDLPAARVPFRDPVFGTCVVRVTDSRADLAPEDPSGGLKNEYSRVQSFNADDSLILVLSTEANWYLYDAVTLHPLGQLPLVVEPRWDAEDPFLVYHIDGTRLLAYNVQTGIERQLHDFAEDFPGEALAAVWTRYEGSPSVDGRLWGLMAEDAQWATVGFAIYDLMEDEVIATRELPPSEIDSVSMSPLGTYFLAYFDTYCDEGQLGDDAHPCGLMVYDQGLRNGRGLLRIVGHSDTALDSRGREVVVYQAIDTDTISMVDLATGDVTALRSIDFSHTPLGLHFSGRAFRRPGWAVVSTYSGGHPTSYTWMDNQVFVIELRPAGRVVRLAHTHSIVDEDEEHDYWAEPHATANADLTRVLWTSNWGCSGTDQVEMVSLDLPPDWPDQLAVR